MGPLTDLENARIFQETVVPLLYGEAIPSSDPVCYYIGGQPGSGKSGLLFRIAADLRRLGGIAIEGDQLRAFHPAYMEMVRADPFRIVGWTAADAARWIERSIAHALERRLSFVMESTLRSPDVALEKLGRVRGAGFGVRLCVFAVPRLVSRARCFLRQEKMLKAAGSTRVVERAIHDTAFENNLLFLRRAIARWGCADVLVFDETGAVITTGEEGPNALLDHYIAARERAYSQADLLVIRQDLEAAQSLMRERAADADVIEAMQTEFADIR